MLVIKIGDENEQRVEMHVEGAAGQNVTVFFDGEKVKLLTDIRMEFGANHLNVLGVTLWRMVSQEPNVDFIQYMRKHGYCVRLKRPSLDGDEVVDLMPFETFGQYPERHVREKQRYQEPAISSTPVVAAGLQPKKAPAATAMQVTTEDRNAVMDVIAGHAVQKSVGEVKAKADKVEPAEEGEKVQAKIEKQVPDQPGFWYLVAEGNGMKIEDKWTDIIDTIKSHGYESGTVFRRARKTESGWLYENTIEVDGFQK